MSELSELFERFFIDHGTIHDRKTGRHVRTDPDFGPGRAFGEDGIEECCALLNQLALAGFDAENDLRSQLAAAVRERDALRTRAQELTEEVRVQSESGDNFSEMQQALRVLRRDLATAIEALEWYVGRLNGEHAARALDAIRGRGVK